MVKYGKLSQNTQIMKYLTMAELKAIFKKKILKTHVRNPKYPHQQVDLYRITKMCVAGS